MMVVKLLDVDLPVNFILGAVLNGDGHVTAVVESAELGLGDFTAEDGASDGLLDGGFEFGLSETVDFSTHSFSLFQSGSGGSGFVSADFGNSRANWWSGDSGCLREVTKCRVHVLGKIYVIVLIELFSTMVLAEHLTE